MEKFNYDNGDMPAEFRGFSPMMINALLNLGFNAKETIVLLRYANENNEHPDWSEATKKEIAKHFYSLGKFLL